MSIPAPFCPPHLNLLHSRPEEYAEGRCYLCEVNRLNEEFARLRSEIQTLGVTATKLCFECGVPLGLVERVSGSVCGPCWHDTYRCNDFFSCFQQWKSGEGAEAIRTRAAVNGRTRPTAKEYELRYHHTTDDAEVMPPQP